ncbi:helix-turn-helix domain-containing protein [Planktothrix prolifica]|uniref:helix-turn-helix domain-containing protein n=1 Tax=Planktothrix prolifica TaxID=54307 RepID=UPI0004235841|nr:helix-turn-helix transcriptional regulator [Planktothrix prolifica]
MTTNLALLIIETDGVEFYTDITTGKSGISQTGLATLCGVSRQAVSKLINSLSTHPTSDFLKDLLDKGFQVADLKTKTPSGLILCSSELSVAVIMHYASTGKKEAIFALTKFAAIGFNSWVQSLTGWQSQPQSQPSEPARLKNWTPPELYPQMTQAEFEAIPVDEQWLYLESPQERRNRQRQELREIGYWTSRKHG